MLRARVHAPRLDDRVVELEQRREADRALHLRGTHLREPAQVHGAEREVRAVRHLQRRQDAPFRAERAALRDRELPQRVRRPSHARERPRRDLDAARICGNRVCLIPGRDALLRVRLGRDGARPSRHFRRLCAVPVGEVAREPRDGARVRTLHRHGGRGVERDGLVHVADEFNRHRQRRELHRVGIRLVTGNRRQRKKAREAHRGQTVCKLEFHSNRHSFLVVCSLEMFPRRK